MAASLFPLQYLIAVVALWLGRQQQEAIDYLKEENRLLKEKLGDRKLHFTDAERRRLATRAKLLGRKRLAQLDTLVTPDTLLRWHRGLVAQKQKWNPVYRRKPGRPRIHVEIVALILRMAQENPRWGYTRIQGALSNVGHKVARGTIANVLKEHGIDPAPIRGRRTSWSTFLKAHWKIWVASDFFTIEVSRRLGHATHDVYRFLERSTHFIRIASVTTSPDAAWIIQIAGNAIDIKSGLSVGEQKVLTDHDSKYGEAFRAHVTRAGSELIRSPPRALYWYTEAVRAGGSMKAEYLCRRICVGDASWRRPVREFDRYCYTGRNHQWLDKQIVARCCLADYFTADLSDYFVRLCDRSVA
jgi:putative transposase